jgi:hypothetical protein
MSEYRQHASECRTLAAHMMAEEHREQLLAMASTWDRMAEERARALRGEIAPGADIGLEDLEG